MAEPAPEEVDPDRILSDWALDEADLREVMRARGPDAVPSNGFVGVGFKPAPTGAVIRILRLPWKMCIS